MKYKLNKENIQFFGGRGATFSEALTNNRKGKSNYSGQDDLPARMNKLFNGKNMSFEHTLEVFKDIHATDTKQEHGILMDSNGFVNLYTHGESDSVYLTMRSDRVTHNGKATKELITNNKIAVHNHPNNSFYSKADLQNFAVSPVKATVVVGQTQDYVLTKTSNFTKTYNRSGSKTTKVSGAKSNAEKFYNYIARHNYSEIESFLGSKNNQKKYGFTYEKRKK